MKIPTLFLAFISRVLLTHALALPPTPWSSWCNAYVEKDVSVRKCPEGAPPYANDDICPKVSYHKAGTTVGVVCSAHGDGVVDPDDDLRREIEWYRDSDGNWSSAAYFATVGDMCLLQDLDYCTEPEEAPATPDDIPSEPKPYPPSPGYFFSCPLDREECWRDYPAPSDGMPDPVCEYVNLDLPADHNLFYKTVEAGLYIRAAKGTEPGIYRKCKHVGVEVQHGGKKGSPHDSRSGAPGQCLSIEDKTISAIWFLNAESSVLETQQEDTFICGLYHDDACKEHSGLVMTNLNGISLSSVPDVTHAQCW